MYSIRAFIFMYKFCNPSIYLYLARLQIFVPDSVFLPPWWQSRIVKLPIREHLDHSERENLLNHDYSCHHR